PIVEALRKNDADTLEDADWFRDHVDLHRQIEIRSYRETRKYKGVIVVDPASANPGIANVESIPVEGKDHIDICKCGSHKDIVYSQVKELVRRIAEAPWPGMRA